MITLVPESAALEHFKHMLVEYPAFTVWLALSYQFGATSVSWKLESLRIVEQSDSYSEQDVVGHNDVIELDKMVTSSRMWRCAVAELSKVTA